jgi:hypothetical protein
MFVDFIIDSILVAERVVVDRLEYVQYAGPVLFTHCLGRAVDPRQMIGRLARFVLVVLARELRLAPGPLARIQISKAAAGIARAEHSGGAERAARAE